MATVIVKRFNVVGNGFDTENAAVFSVRRKFCPLYSKNGSALREFSGAALDGTTEPEVQAIARLNGVVSVASFSHDSLYDLHVKKAAAYSWEELVPTIEALLTARDERLTASEVAELEALHEQ